MWAKPQLDIDKILSTPIIRRNFSRVARDRSLKIGVRNLETNR